uniref:Cadherin-like beta sandwich domain-containing protein n=1 Tax=Strigamia maritima TaxID=126957 RepID=T1JPJ4_STRMM
MHLFIQVTVPRVNTRLLSFELAMRSIRCRSTRDILLAAGAFSILSLYITYQLGSPLVDRGILAASESEKDQLVRAILSQMSAGPKTKREMKPSKLETKLIQLERRRREAIATVGKVALIRGQKGIVEHEYNLTARDNWLLLLCMSFTDGDSGTCLERSSYSHLEPYQKINRIYGIRNSLWRKDGFCSTMTSARQLSVARRSHLTPLCFVLPNQMQQFVHVADALGEDAQWVVKPLSPGGGAAIELLENLDRIKNTQQAVLVQQYFPHPFLVFGSPVSLRVYILVTSMSPLRAFLFHEGIVYFRQSVSKGFRKMSNRTWLLSQLWHYVARSYGQHAVRLALVNIQSLVVQTLLVAESMIAVQLERKLRCQHCFQMLGFDLILNASFHPVVLEVSQSLTDSQLKLYELLFSTKVNGQPNLQESWRDDGWAANGVKRGLVEGMLSLLFATSDVARHVADAVDRCADNIGVMGLNCRISNDLCLSEDDLHLLMDARREKLNRGAFKQLYPSVDSDKYTGLIQDLQYFVALPKVSSSSSSSSSSPRLLSLRDREAFTHGTADMHAFLTSLERCYSRHREDDYDFWNSFNVSAAFRAPENTSQAFGTQDLLSRPPCNEVTMPYLLNIFSQPKLNLTPPFSPLVVEFTAKVPYDQLMVTVWAFAQNCQSEARLDDKFGPSQSANYTLGLGENRITFVIVDIRHTEPWVINSYSIVVERAAPTDNEPIFDANRKHQVCALKQDCDLRLVANDPCGIQKDDGIKKWSDYEKVAADLPVCDRGDALGRWLLPCTACSDRSSCFWRQAFWAPFECQHPFISQSILAQCLAGKKLLFIGDSTNRGIMHYLMERLNGTLAEWDKTHHIRVRTNLNGGKTVISFAYYPQFWLPTNERPVFNKALYQLLERSRPLENNSNTVLIVGGVHWLATQHLHMLLQALRRDGLQGIRLVMKTLGSGFHLPVNGVHCLSQVEQRKLLVHSRGLSEFAKHYNFDIIDTFNITIPRFRDFLQGKCACHFHKVVPLALDSANREYRYHVEGPVNAVYSEILISRLCSDHVVPVRDGRRNVTSNS